MFLLRGEELVEMREQPYDSEDLLQKLLASYPELLAGGELAGSPRRWLLVKREAGVPDREAGGDRWSLDHLFIDQDAVPTLVEVKRSDDTRIRREVVGQMLDYAANGVVYWPAERLRADFEARCAGEHADVFRDSLGDEADPEQFWDAVGQNLRSGRIRLVFVSDLIPPELRRVIEFLNERMTPTEVVGVEIRQYVGERDLRTLVPRVVGQTEQARIQKVGGGRSLSGEVSWDDYKARLQPDRFALVRAIYDRMEEAIAKRGLGWTPKSLPAYFVFQRRDYNCAGADVKQEAPVNFWVKLPLSPDELRGRGHDIPRLYPELQETWDARNKLLRWTVPSAQAVPDLMPAIELTSRYQPSTGAMPVPAHLGGAADA